MKRDMELVRKILLAIEDRFISGCICNLEIDGYDQNTVGYQQFFALKEIIKTVTTYNDNGNRCGGVIWHTQGSGKSLTMDMVSKYGEPTRNP